MAHAYTPGLKVLQKTTVDKERRLPLKGDVLVEAGKKVAPDDIVASTHLPGNVQMVNIANLLNIDAQDIDDVMLVEIGSEIKEGELLGETKGLFGFFKSSATSPVDGVLESISDITGQVVLREKPIPVEIDAYMNGKVASVLEKEGVVVTANAVFIQGIFGMGGENRGELRVLVDNREDELTPEMIPDDVKGAVIVGGSFVSLEAYKKAISVGAAAVVAGGFNYNDLQDVLGYVLGVAITGSEDLGTSLILTEGYGRIPMGNRSFELLQQHNGKFTSVHASTQIRAGVIRPEILIPLTVEDAMESKSEKDTASGISAGSMVRVIRAPYFGDIGTVVSLPSKLQQLESETMVRVAEVEIGGETLVIPRANLEMVETN